MTGTVAEAPLARLTWFRAGGVAEHLFTPKNIVELGKFLGSLPDGAPRVILGAGSNLLVRDGGIPGVTIRIGRGIADIYLDGELVIFAEAGAMLRRVAHFAALRGVGGFAFLDGIPGTIGGAVRMNAGAHGAAISDRVVDVVLLDEKGKTRILPNNALGFGYRRSALPPGWVIIGAHMRGKRGEHAAIIREMADLRDQRKQTQPQTGRTGGSTFKNPESCQHGAWFYIEKAGCRGLRRGRVRVSEKHCNFLIADAGVLACEIEALGEEVRRRVQDSCGILLQWEIERIGIEGGSVPGDCNSG